MDDSIHAVMFTAPRKAELVPVPTEPVSMGLDSVAGRTIASLISTGTELNSGYLGTKFPVGTGYACVFAVEQVGENIRDLVVGDHVFAMAPHRSWQCRECRDVIKLPAGLDPVAATFARLMAVSMTTLHTTRARPNHRVLVTGLGPVGHLAAQMFQSCGYRVTAVDPAAARRDHAADKGISDVREAVPIDDSQMVRQFALAVECSGHEQAVLDACQLLRRRGELVLVGVPWKPRTNLTAFQLLHEVFHHYLDLRSGWEWELPRTTTPEVSGPAFPTESVMGNVEHAMRWLADGRVDVTGLYDLVDPRNAQQVYADLLEQRSDRIATVFDWSAWSP